MALLGWARGLPRYVQVAAPMLALLVAFGGAALLLSTRHPAPLALLPSPTPAVSPSPDASPSPSPDATPSPSPSDAPTAPAPAPPAAPPPPVQGGSCAPPPGGFPGTQLAANYATALAWSPDGRLFWTERAGTIKVFEGGAVHDFASVATVTTEPGGAYSERGLLGLAISGTFVFAMYSNTDYRTQTIVRWTDCAGAATNRVVLEAGLPAGSDCCHKGGRLATSPDGHLFATIGDNHSAASAQAAGDLRGKVTRFNLDGSGQAVWTSGLRNPFGIAFAPDGTLALTNNGPSNDAGTPCGSCGDEFYVVGKSAGVDYQWPICWGYSHPVNGDASCGGHPGPQYSTEGGGGVKSNTPYFVAPTGMTWSSTRGGFVFCANSNGTLYQYVSQGTVSDTGIRQCSLDVKQGPDGALYTSTAGGIYRH